MVRWRRHKHCLPTKGGTNEFFAHISDPLSKNCLPRVSASCSTITHPVAQLHFNRTIALLACKPKISQTTTKTFFNVAPYLSGTSASSSMARLLLFFFPILCKRAALGTVFHKTILFGFLVKVPRKFFPRACRFVSVSRWKSISEVTPPLSACNQEAWGGGRQEAASISTLSAQVGRNLFVLCFLRGAMQVN